MARLMSVALTEAAVVARTKTVTRRDGWLMLKPGDRLTLCRKVMGRRRADGTVDPLVRLAEVEVVDVRRERLWDITDEDIAREGVPAEVFEDVYVDTGQPTCTAWVQWFCEAHRGVWPDTEITRIEWRYLDPAPVPAEPASQPEEKVADLMAALFDSVVAAKAERARRRAAPVPAEGEGERT